MENRLIQIGLMLRPIMWPLVAFTVLTFFLSSVGIIETKFVAVLVTLAMCWSCGLSLVAYYYGHVGVERLSPFYRTYSKYFLAYYFSFLLVSTVLFVSNGLASASS